VKFYDAENLEGWVLTCDDDLIYPKGYVKYMTSRAEAYKGIVTLHGKIYRRPIQFNPADETYRCLEEVERDMRVDVGGTGVMCYHTDMIKVAYNAFKIANMADLWMAKLAKEQGVGIYTLKHPEDYLIYQNPEETIWRVYRDTGFEIQTKVLKSFL